MSWHSSNRVVCLELPTSSLMPAILCRLSSISQHTEDGFVLYNLDDDPGENTDLAASAPEAVEMMKEKLESTRDALGLPELDAPIEMGAEREMSDAERQALCELGYLEC